MCGICGMFSPSGFSDPEAVRFRVEATLGSLSHRGPDAAGLNLNEFAVLGAARLGIRGLADGHQPMVDPETGIVAICNGEIDNHHELRHWLEARGRPVRALTDVAVIPGLFVELGEAFVTSLAGAFAVALWDPRTKLLTLARDRAGERPLFFAVRGEEVAFATEIAALVSLTRWPMRLDEHALRQYLQFGIFPSPNTPFTGLSKIAPGELLQFGHGGMRRRTYWRWDITSTAKQTPSLDVFDEVFRCAVRRQSDVEVDFGVFLSGGIDSSLVSAVARSLHPTRPMKAYTLRFDEESYDEWPFAQAVAHQLEMELVTVWVRPDEAPSELKALVRLVGEPLADPAW
ncbi:MAG: asparagine synthetase B family protein, partial [Limisphaerales bacterium]